MTDGMAGLKAHCILLRHFLKTKPGPVDPVRNKRLAADDEELHQDIEHVQSLAS